MIIFAGNSAYSQASLSSEAGLMFGVTSFQTDFGLRHDFDSENAATMGFGVMHYLKFLEVNTVGEVAVLFGRSILC